MAFTLARGGVGFACIEFRNLMLCALSGVSLAAKNGGAVLRVARYRLLMLCVCGTSTGYEKNCDF